MKMCRTVLILSMMITCILSAQGTPELQWQGHLGGFPAAVDVHDGTAYLMQGIYLSLLDVSGELWMKTAEFEVGVEPRDIVYHEGCIYCFNTWSDTSLMVVDVSDPQNLQISAKLPIHSGRDFRGVFSGDRLYVVMGDSMAVLDISDPKVPVLLSYLNVRGQEIALDGDALCTATADSLLIYNFANPEAPVLLGGTPREGIMDMEVRGNLVYTAIYVGFGTPARGLMIYDISDPAQPALRSFVETWMGTESNRFLKNPRKLIVDGTMVYLGTSVNACLFVIDASDPDDPQVLGKAEFDLGSGPAVNSMSWNSPYMYMTTSTSSWGVIRVDLSNPAAPTLVTPFHEPWDVKHLCSSGDTLFMASNERLWIYQFENGKQIPTLLGADTTYHNFNRIAVSGGMLYGIRGTSLMMVDYSYPPIMHTAGAYDSPHGDLMDLAVGDHVYLMNRVFNGNATLDILDVSDPTTPQSVGTYALPGEGRDLFLNPADGYLYAAYSTSEEVNGVQILDVSDPAAVTVVGHFSSHGIPAVIHVADTTALVGSHVGFDQWFLESVSVNDPTQPVALTQVDGQGNLFDISVYNGMVTTSVQGTLNEAIAKQGVTLNLMDLNPALHEQVQKWMNERGAKNNSSMMELPGGLFFFQLLGLAYVFGMTLPPVVFMAMALIASIVMPVFCLIMGYGCIGMLDASGSMGMLFMAVMMGASDVDHQDFNGLALREFNLSQNYPNPFNPETNIQYTVPRQSAVKLTVYDMLGRQVAVLVDEVQSPGEFTVEFDGHDLPSGIYTYQIEMDGQRLSRKMMMVK